MHFTFIVPPPLPPPLMLCIFNFVFQKASYILASVQGNQIILCLSKEQSVKPNPSPAVYIHPQQFFYVINFIFASIQIPRTITCLSKEQTLKLKKADPFPYVSSYFELCFWKYHLLFFFGPRYPSNSTPLKRTDGQTLKSGPLPLRLYLSSTVFFSRPPSFLIHASQKNRLSNFKKWALPLRL